MKTEEHFEPRELWREDRFAPSFFNGKDIALTLCPSFFADGRTTIHSGGSVKTLGS